MKTIWIIYFNKMHKLEEKVPLKNLRQSSILLFLFTVLLLSDGKRSWKQSGSGGPDSGTVNALHNYAHLVCTCRSKCGRKMNASQKDKELFCHEMTEMDLLNYGMII